MAISTLTKRPRHRAGMRAAGVVAAAALVLAGCADDDDDDEADTAAPAITVDVTEAEDEADDAEDEADQTEPEDEADEAEDDADDFDLDLDVDNCALLTDEEASELNGDELVADGDSPLGCPYVEPGGAVGQIILNSFRIDADFASFVDELYTSPAFVTPLEGIGDEAVAIATPAGDAIAAFMAREGDLVVLLVVVFVDIDEEDPAAVQAAAEYAGIALERLVAAA